jgi:hypothetical protein
MGFPVIEQFSTQQVRVRFQETGVRLLFPGNALEWQANQLTAID